MLFDIIRSAPWWVWVTHLLLYPVYQILGTLKHEGAHALVGVAQGLRVLEFHVLPERVNGQWFWGRVLMSGRLSPLGFLAPYIVDVIVFTIGVLTAGHWVSGDWWITHVWMFFMTMILLVVLPIVDLIYNVIKWWIWDRGDFAEAFGSGE